MPQQIQLLVAINGATFLAIMVYGYKIVTFLNQIKFKTDLMWDDYQRRTGFVHKRESDEFGDRDRDRNRRDE